MGSDLTPKQSRFVSEYLKDLNATQASIRAGYSAKTADTQGPRLLENVGIRRAIDAALARRAERVEVKSDDILRSLLELAMADIGEAFDELGALKPLKDIPPSVRRAIAGIDVVHLPPVDGVEQGVVKKVKFWDKPKSLELLGKHLRLFVDKVEVSADSSFADLLKAARERADRR